MNYPTRSVCLWYMSCDDSGEVCAVYHLSARRYSIGASTCDWSPQWRDIKHCRRHLWNYWYWTQDFFKDEHQVDYFKVSYENLDAHNSRQYDLYHDFYLCTADVIYW